MEEDKSFNSFLVTLASAIQDFDYELDQAVLEGEARWNRSQTTEVVPNYLQELRSMQARHSEAFLFSRIILEDL